MYQYLEDKNFVRKMRGLAGSIMQSLCHRLKTEYGIGATFYLVGSGARNLIVQNGEDPVDLDYNLEIVKCENILDGRYLKESVKAAFNYALARENLHDCEDSTSVLSSKRIAFLRGNDTEFSIDVAIVRKDQWGTYHRLIHHKTGIAQWDTYYWTPAPNSGELQSKVEWLKEHGKWELVRDAYLTFKNRYLSWRMADSHPSFVCYVEAVNQVYYAERNRIR